jgi:Ca-activated chloride channel family protein
MRQRRPIEYARCVFALAFAAMAAVTNVGKLASAEPPPLPGGVLNIVDASGRAVDGCPLEHTEVQARIDGFISRVEVRQRFRNQRTEKVEAIYVFPLPPQAAVDGMVMTVGSRRIVGQIRPRDQAQEIYRAALAAGHVASLLEQERPNVFTQSVANIEPGATVTIEISYVDMLPFDDGVFEFRFPTVVGPRYMPSLPCGHEGSGSACDTTQVPDASRISPPVAPPGMRAGHDIGLSVTIDAGGDLYDMESISHEIETRSLASGKAKVSLRDRKEIPNRDFILRYRTATERIEDAFLVHEDERGRFFTLILEPPRRVAASEAVPKEMIFVIDRSGSMSGLPIEKAKAAMRLAIERTNPRDTFNLLSFSGGTGLCFEKPVPSTPENRATALRYLDDLHGSGGTEMMPAIHAALKGPYDAERVRIVAFMTDGMIGNDFAIIDAVRRNARSARVFAFAIGGAVNLFLLDGMARAGRGEVEYVELASNADEAVERFQERIQSPVLTDVEIDWGSLPVVDVYPKAVPDLFSVKPVLIHGRLTGPADGTITLRGRTTAGPFERSVVVEEARSVAGRKALASLWARAAVGEFEIQSYLDSQHGTASETTRNEITRLGVEYSLITSLTSFVAVEELRVTVGGAATTVTVPVELPAGMQYEGVFEAHGQATTMFEARAATSRSPGVMALGVAGASAAYVRREGAARGGGILASAGGGDSPSPAKLAEPLRTLAATVERDGKDGTLAVGNLRVVGYRVDVVVYLREASKTVVDALDALGFKTAGEAGGGKVVVGSIDVRKLEELARLDAVTLVTTL